MDPRLYRNRGPRFMEGVSARAETGVHADLEFSANESGAYAIMKIDDGISPLVKIDMVTLLSWVAENEPYLFLDEMAKQRQKVKELVAATQEWQLTEEEIDELLK